MVQEYRFVNPQFLSVSVPLKPHCPISTNHPVRLLAGNGFKHHTVKMKEGSKLE
jgi:hypothetical protein